ncbi:heme-binding protein [Blastopirellula marina]|uniref:SOUL heme-binding protein n=1 Tax=Blastopirellula marina TaxID=124 RepID=A0A2S8GHQ8_9BACT|nr:heme-binding protein [Blastopirellula marina]PQO43966.1 hypothetical protein C5Y93_22565 [Blastopirellula marina]
MKSFPLLLALALFPLLSGWTLGGDPEEEDAAVKAEVTTLISSALAEEKDQTPGARLKKLQQAADAVQAKFPRNVLVAEPLQAADSADALEKALRQAQKTLTFQIKHEADLPAGFPQPTPVGEIGLKQYPAYRLAKTGSRNDSGFFKLFTHITLNRIEMTAPVEMTYDSGQDQSPQQTAMAFLYGDPTIGQVGDKLGGVNVADVPAITTVSMGLAGDVNPKRLAETERRLETWLSQHAPEYERTGKLRVLGYNSPRIADERRYFEVELPVGKK